MPRRDIPEQVKDILYGQRVELFEIVHYDGDQRLLGVFCREIQPILKRMEQCTYYTYRKERCTMQLALQCRSLPLMLMACA